MRKVVKSVENTELRQKTGTGGVEKSPRRFTYAQLRAEMAETNHPCELWKGEIVTPPARSFHHLQIAFRFQRALHDWVYSHDLGEMVGAPIDIRRSPIFSSFLSPGAI
jgi:hypothetical protein